MSTTLQNLRIKCRTAYLKIDPNAKVRDDNMLDFYLNEWKRQVQNDAFFDLPENQAEYVITTQAWVKEYDLPDRFRKLETIAINGEKLRLSSKSKCMWKWLWVPSEYYLYNNKVWLYPTPKWELEVEMLYSQELNEMDNAIWTELPVDYDDLIVLYATYLMLISVEKTEKANMVRNQYNNQRDVLFARFYDDENLTFNIMR